MELIDEVLFELSDPVNIAPYFFKQEFEIKGTICWSENEPKADGAVILKLIERAIEKTKRLAKKPALTQN